ncbi:MAG: 23S rRNA (uracil(1939)-C(5))-methyltransferase RlmD [Bacteroidetes bacterium]|nr:23S rRNA (uracil(1939)-C(5))-methyltransferase RlmD [Bacteroidota bacterium]
MKQQELIQHIHITDAGAEGNAIARFEDRVIFVPYGIPGDLVDILVTKKKRRFWMGRIATLIAGSPDRVEPVCIHFGTCGGCRWQHMHYGAQLRYKQKQVLDALTHIGKLEIPEISPIIPSPFVFQYRNKLEFSTSTRKWHISPPQDHEEAPSPGALGFHIPGFYDKVLEITECHLQAEPNNLIRNEIRNFALQNHFSYFDFHRAVGFLRNIIIRTTRSGELMVIIVFDEDKPTEINGLLQHVLATCPTVTSLFYVINPKRNDTLWDLEHHLFHGKPFITETMVVSEKPLQSLSFRIAPKSFFQTNAYQAERMYQIIASMASLNGQAVVYDLYSGTGTIALFLAGKAGRVIGLESVKQAVDDAWENAQANGISNVSFHPGEAEKILDDAFIEAHGRPSLIITDPPRAGMHEKVVKKILEIQAERVIYVSCNPATQARDLAMMSSSYNVVQIQPLDMFPHTQHVENIVLLERKAGSAPEEG